jgi:chromosome segregation protein
VYVNRLELTNFKSFGGTTAVPTLTGFTVISGPNGSGKSNLLDAILFALGLSGSKGMRAERLPDLVNHAQLKRGHSVVETKVTVSFALEPQDLEMLGADAERYIYRPEPVESKDPGEAGAPQPEELNEGAATIAIQVSEPATANGAEDAPEWHVTRRLRVTKQGTYTSSYAMNGQPCNLGELHDYLSRLRIYPEGYNVVLQGDVTGIITMNPRQRREIIDELAGVADFDRKINQAREKLEAVKEQEERFRIVEQELVDQRDRLARDRLKAEKYKVLRAELQEKSTWEGVLNCRHLRTQIQTLHQQIKDEEARQAALVTQIQENQETVDRLTTELATMNAKVKAMGEQEQLKVQAEIATQEAELRQLQRQQEELDTALETGQTTLEQRQLEIEAFEQQLTELQAQKQTLEQSELVALQDQLNQAQADLGAIRRNAQTLASSADAWIQQQTQLRQQLDTLRQALDPRRAEQVQLQERREQLLRQQQSATEELTPISTQIEAQQLKLTEVQAEVEAELTQVQTLAEGVATLDQEITTNQQTLTRLEQERRDKQRQLDKLEAQEQAQQDAQGTYASQIILKSSLEGVYGLVANLGRVEPDYQLALEISAGARMGHLVVADDRVAAAGIELLKQERGGRATFLPLNKVHCQIWVFWKARLTML